MDDLIEAFNIFRRYSDTKYPTHCEHDTLYVLVDYDIVSEQDINRLEKLGFITNEESGIGFLSYRFGSA